MTPFRLPFRATPRNITLLTLSLPALLATRAAMSTNTNTPPPPSSSPPNPPKTQFPTRPYIPRHTTYPYTPHDFLRADESPDTDFYAEPRFVTHIDEHAIGLLKEYYEGNLPRRGRVLDLCSSWVSHFPRGRAVGGKAESAAGTGKGKMEEKGEEGLEVVGLGMNAAEMEKNPILKEYILRDLNAEPDIPERVGLLDATVCTVSIDYLTQPLAVMKSLLARTKVGGKVHLVVSNRCFPSKVVGRWLRVGEEERVQMVGDYLWWAGWRGVEVVEVCGGRGGGWFGGWDPLWVVRGVKVEGEGEGKAELMA